MIVPCECGAKLKIDDAKIPDHRGVKVHCPRCGRVLQIRKPVPEPVSLSSPEELPRLTGTSDMPLVLVAHDSDVLRGVVSRVLLDAGFRVDTAADGVEALRKATEGKPHGMVLDVGIPGIYGFELCDRLKGNPETEAIKIVLLSSVYDMRRYKRKPTNLYGADDYIEKHHISDSLPHKLRRLISPDGAAGNQAQSREDILYKLPEMSRPPDREFETSQPTPGILTQMEREVSNTAPLKRDASRMAPHDTLMPESISLDASIFQKEECDIPRVEESDPEAVEKARRFARIIVSDIALYNQDAVLEGIKNGSWRELLKNDVEEGRQLYEGRVPGIIKAKADYYQEAIDNFILTARQKIVH